jgi:hypothetical protein
VYQSAPQAELQGGFVRGTARNAGRDSPLAFAGSRAGIKGVVELAALLLAEYRSQ